MEPYLIKRDTLKNFIRPTLRSKFLRFSAEPVKIKVKFETDVYEHIRR